ncbi:MAG: MotA/TolQ/ExbB proton channel family protein [Acidobacteriota bacterium]
MILEIFQKGGVVMYPLLLCSVAALAIIIERLVNLRKSRVLKDSNLDYLAALIDDGMISKALEVCRNHPGIFNNIVKAGLEHHHLGREDAKEAIMDAGRHEVPRLQRYLTTLGTIVGISPLLGLLGTVTGMMKLFKAIADVGTGQPGALSSGIYEALITTVAGLSIAIPSLVFYNYFQKKAEEVVIDLERNSIEILKKLFDYKKPQ